MLLIEGPYKSLLLGFHKDNWRRKIYYRIPENKEFTSPPSLEDCLSMKSRGFSQFRPKFEQVSWLPPYDFQNFVAGTPTFKKKELACFLWKCWQYFHAPEDLATEGNQFADVDDIRWTRWVVEADRKKNAPKKGHMEGEFFIQDPEDEDEGFGDDGDFAATTSTATQPPAATPPSSNAPMAPPPPPEQKNGGKRKQGGSDGKTATKKPRTSRCSEMNPPSRSDSHVLNKPQDDSGIHMSSPPDQADEIMDILRAVRTPTPQPNSQRRTSLSPNETSSQQSNHRASTNSRDENDKHSSDSYKKDKINGIGHVNEDYEEFENDDLLEAMRQSVLGMDPNRTKTGYVNTTDYQGQQTDEEALQAALRASLAPEDGIGSQ